MPVHDHYALVQDTQPEQHCKARRLVLSVCALLSLTSTAAVSRWINLRGESDGGPRAEDASVVALASQGDHLPKNFLHMSEESNESIGGKYLQKYQIEQFLSGLLEKLTLEQPADPYSFIAGQANSQSALPAAATAAAGATPAAVTVAETTGTPTVDVATSIKDLGEKIRALKERLKKEGKSGKEVNEHEEVKSFVAQLQALKAEQAAAEGTAAVTAPKAKAAPKEAKAKNEKSASKAQGEPSKGGGLYIKKAEDVPGWYEQVLVKAELVEAYPIKGCFVLRPWSYRIWELIQAWMDVRIKEMGVQNCYFPMFIPKCYIEKEEEHLNDFAPELAWVSKFGNSELEEPVAIRPTSETAMYAAYANWVQSHRDLPIKLNQWCNVVRWEVKQTTPFLRTREFLWQEGHSAFANQKDAEEEVTDILELYARIYEELLAIPVVRGTKTKAETFPGAEYTKTVEAFVPATGRGIQGATSHHLGQHFSRMFDISFQEQSTSANQTHNYAYQNSWGITTRTIGVLTMVHGDDKGLVLPPEVACLQVVLVPVGLKVTTSEEDQAAVRKRIVEYYLVLKREGIRAKLDDSDNTPGWKFNHWEMKGVPLRIELGPMEVEKDEFVMAKRNILDPKASKIIGKDLTFVDDVKQALESIQKELYDKALAERDARMVNVDKWEDFSPTLNTGKLVLVPFCGDPECEDKIKAKSKEEAAEAEVAGGLTMGAKSLCVPHEEKYNVECPSKCIFSDCQCRTVKRRTLFGRSY